MRLEGNRREWIFRLLQAASTVALLPAALEATDWAPQCLSREQNSILVAVGEAIVPGSTAANCNRVIDGILAIESGKNQEELKSALNAFQSFLSTTPEKRSSLLGRAAEAGDPRQAHFELIKEWVADTYWSSEQGLKELGWDGRVAWAAYPGCEKHGG